MFTGIVTAMGRVVASRREGERRVLRIEAPYPTLEVGESVAVSGVCLTVTTPGAGWFEVDVIATTRGRTWLAEAATGSAVNLERALQAGDRLGGHFVQGHVDGLADVGALAEDGDTLLVDLRLPDEVADVTLLHGSLAVDGVSLTVNALPGPGLAQVALIPHTRRHTTLGALAPGRRVHVEGDMIGKYVRQLLEARHHAI